MAADALLVRSVLRDLGVHVGRRSHSWNRVARDVGDCPLNDHDIVALHLTTRRAVVAEVEGYSSAQPETKVYKAVGQVIAGLDWSIGAGWMTVFGVVVHGDRIGRHLARCHRLSALGVFGLQIGATLAEDKLIFGKPGL
jgi:hypothetical protein